MRVLQSLQALSHGHRHRPGEQVLRSGKGRGQTGGRALQDAGEERRKLRPVRPLRQPLSILCSAKQTDAGNPGIYGITVSEEAHAGKQFERSALYVNNLVG